MGIIARQLADCLDAPGWVERKLSAVQVVRRASQAVVDELGITVTLACRPVATKGPFRTEDRTPSVVKPCQQSPSDPNWIDAAPGARNVRV
ncbi:hypothetical protein, partial [Streptomyces aureus]|uniref:hypothetical protein n=1 Tax=Streptomyces aureus TaxID=193461 RepID=UPI0031DC580B